MQHDTSISRLNLTPDSIHPSLPLQGSGAAVLALIHGEPLMDFPHDLFVPPEALRVFLDAFEGPLDLLLYLIRRDNINILDIPMARVTRQYLEYVELMRQNQLELAAEYLLMAAMLIEIKSRLLLPVPPRVEDDTLDPRADLVRRLLEYEKIRAAAERINALPQEGRDFELAQVWFERVMVVNLPEVRTEDLQRAWRDILKRMKQNRHHIVPRESLSVRSVMANVLRQLRDSDAQFIAFAELFASVASVAQVVVTFLAVLELAREGLADVQQSEAFATIYVALRRESL